MLLLYARGAANEVAEPIVGRTRLLKMVFLFDKEVRRDFNLDRVIPDQVMPQFEPYHYGPFSADVLGDLEFLVEMGFVSVTRLVNGEPLPEERDEYAYYRATTGQDDEDPAEGVVEESFALTPLGREFVEQGEAGELSEQQRAVLDRFKARCTATPLRELLRYVYSKYPEYTTKSKIRDEVLG